MINGNSLLTGFAVGFFLCLSIAFMLDAPRWLTLPLALFFGVSGEYLSFKLWAYFQRGEGEPSAESLQCVKTITPTVRKRPTLSGGQEAG